MDFTVSRRSGKSLGMMSQGTDLKTEIAQIRLPKGTGARMDRVLKGGEIRAAFVRAAVEAELRRREGMIAKKKGADNQAP